MSSASDQRLKKFRRADAEDSLSLSVGPTRQRYSKLPKTSFHFVSSDIQERRRIGPFACMSRKVSSTPRFDQPRYTFHDETNPGRCGRIPIHEGRRYFFATFRSTVRRFTRGRFAGAKSTDLLNQLLTDARVADIPHLQAYCQNAWLHYEVKVEATAQPDPQ